VGFRLRLKELRDGCNLILSGIEFQIVGAANRKALQPMAVVVKGTCKRLSEEYSVQVSDALVTHY